MTVNPFDIKAALTARHAQHVVLVHFPIALFLAGVFFDFAGRWFSKSSEPQKSVLAVVAYYNFCAAAVTSLPVVVTGLLAWRWQLEGQRLKGTLLLHLIFGLGSAILICMVWWVQRRTRRMPERVPSHWGIALEVFAVLVVALTGHLGGFLSGVNVGG